MSTSMGEATLVGKSFTGFYLFVYSWFVLHTLFYFWDILFPWNIDWWDHLYFNGAFMVTVALGMVMTGILWGIWTVPSMSLVESHRWMFNVFPKSMMLAFWYSNMSGEPLPVIGSSWFGADLRYPAFMSNYYFRLHHIAFCIILQMAFKSEDDNAGATHMFRPYWPVSFQMREYKENLTGILGCVYIYASYFFILFAVTESWIEKFILCCMIMFCHGLFGKGSEFYTYKNTYTLSVVLIYALIRSYYSYYEWTKQGSIWVLLLKIFYCLSQILIFIGWYSAPESLLNRWFCPFFKFDLKVETEGLINNTDAEVPKIEESEKSESEESEESESEESEESESKDSEVSDESTGIKEE